MNARPRRTDKSSAAKRTKHLAREIAEGESKGSARRKRCATTSVSDAADTDGFDQEAPGLASDRYQLFEEIARGGMGTVYRAQDHQLRREVAIKILRSKYRENPIACTAFVNEAYMMGTLPHPGVPPIYEYGFCGDGRPFHVMKLVNGITLAELLEREPSSRGECLKVFADVCETLAFAHSREVLHLDLKPSNIMVGAFGEVHVMDWGLAQFQKQIAQEAARRHRRPVHGTPEYMPPEQAKGQLLTTQTDVFGLGAILCEILVGRAPYAGDNVEQVFLMASSGSVSTALNQLDQCDAEPALVRLAKRCLSARPQDRPRDAMTVAREVASYQESALQVAKDDMSRFFELSLDLFCIAGMDGYFRRINSNFSRLLGYSDAELLRRPFLEFVHPRDRYKTTKVMGVLREGQPVVRFRNRYQTAAGSYIVLEWTAKRTEDDHLIFAVARDVTPQPGRVTNGSV